MLGFFILLSLFALHDYTVVCCKMQSLGIDGIWRNIHLYIIFLILFLYAFLLFLSNTIIGKYILVGIFILLLLFLSMTLTIAFIY